MTSHNDFTESWEWADDILDRFLSDMKVMGIRFTGMERRERGDGTTRLLVHGWVNAPDLIDAVPSLVPPISVLRHYMSVGGEMYIDFFPHVEGGGVTLIVDHTSFAALLDTSQPIIAASLDDWCEELRDDVNTFSLKVRDIINGYVYKLTDSLDDEFEYLMVNGARHANSSS
jgi:hypothetical protein